MQRGRVQVAVPAVLGSGRLSWAEACVPYAGDQVGLFAVPPVGANVWVEFEAGDPDHPILAGCFWGAGSGPGRRPADDEGVQDRRGDDHRSTTSRGAAG